MNSGLLKYLQNLRLKLNFRFHWSSEIYSYGKIYRDWLGIPRFLPLIFTSDHGVNLGRAVDPKIFDSPSCFTPHLSWNSNIVEAEDFPKRFRRKGIIHPWIYWRMQRDIKPQIFQKRKGSVVFISHSSGGSTSRGYDDEKLLEYLSLLPNALQPISICIYHGDLDQRERVDHFKTNGFEIVTIGSPWDSNYVDHFYSLLADKRLLISQSYGSQIPLGCEFGIPVLLLGQDVCEVDSDTEKPKVYLSENFRLVEESELVAKRLFNEITNLPDSEQLAWSKEKLGFGYLKAMDKTKYQLIASLVFMIPIWFINQIIFRNCWNIVYSISKDLGKYLSTHANRRE